MKTAIIYYSKHHRNTERLVHAIASKYTVTLFDVTKTTDMKLEGYDCIGFASGIYFSRFQKQVLAAAQAMPVGKKAFFLCTYGSPGAHHLDAITTVAKSRDAEILGSYGCLGFDTFGPFKLVGGLAKGHPTAEEISGAVEFYGGLL